MAEYIEREGVYDIFTSKQQELLKYYRYYQLEREEKEEFDRYDSYLDEIQAIPAADVVEVVRCKDCKHRYEPVNCALWYGTLGDKEYFIDRGENFSCSYGKRKEGAEE